MKKRYAVEITETNWVTVIVEAEDEEQARSLAEDDYLNDPSPDYDMTDYEVSGCRPTGPVSDGD